MHLPSDSGIIRVKVNILTFGLIRSNVCFSLSLAGCLRFLVLILPIPNSCWDKESQAIDSSYNAFKRTIDSILS